MADLKALYETVKKRNPNDPEFLQASRRSLRIPPGYSGQKT